MSSESLSSHSKLLETFRKTFSSGRLAHAYLLFGPIGIGKRKLAMELAKILLCPDEGCGQCAVCKRVETQNHSDFRLIVRKEGNKEVKIEQIRELQSDIHLQPMEGSRKVFILADCQWMNEAASNALLKTLEEPPPNSFLFLLSETLESLPDTICSRCQEVRVPPKPISEIQEVLLRNQDISVETAQLLARIAEGSLGRAEELMETNFLESNEWILEKLISLNNRNELEFASELWERIQKSTNDTQGRRNEFRRYIQIIQTFWRDILSLSAGLPKSHLFHIDEQSLQFYSELSAPSSIAVAVIELTFQVENWIRRNANMKLSIENFAVELSSLMMKARFSIVVGVTSQ